MLKLPSHYHITLADGAQVAENETVEFERFEQVITTVQHRHDFVVIDTPSNSNFLVRVPVMPYAPAGQQVSSHLLS